jgi:3-oxoadipate enol-lactonase
MSTVGQAMLQFKTHAHVTSAYELAGDGPPLLLMHGAEADHRMFADVLPLLARNFTVVSYDQRECGDTQAPPSDATLADLAHDAAELIEALGWRRAHVFGSSFGGRLAQALALLHPEVVDGLVLGSTWPLPLTYETIQPDAERLGALRAQLPASAETLASWFFPEHFLVERPELRRLFASAKVQTERSARRARTIRSPLDLSPAAIRSPTLVLAGSADRVVPPAATQQLAKSIPGSKFELLPGVGHVTVLQAPAIVARNITGFLL